MNLENKPHRMTKPDAQGCDEIRITTVPRYKTSGLSGDEWRISSKIEFIRKGKVIHKAFNGDVEGAVKMLYAHWAQAHDEGKFYFGGEGDLCDQEGCSEKATIVYRLKKRFCCGGGNCGQEIEQFRENIRMFCARHSTRGDCGLEDSDSNYEVIEGYKIEPLPEDKKPAIFGGTVTL